jgi:hypothetical protein
MHSKCLVPQVITAGPGIRSSLPLNAEDGSFTVLSPERLY